FATPASRSTTHASSASSRSSCTAAATSAAGPPSKSTRPSSPPSTCPKETTASTNCATTCASSRATDYCSVTDPDTPIVSPQRAFRYPCSSSSSTNGSAAHSPTAASTTAPPPAISRPAGWKPPITAPTQPSNASSICLLPDVHLASAILGLFLSTIRKGRIYTVPAPGEPGSETWEKPGTWQHGGASTWMTGNYDPKTNIVYWGTGNGSPWFGDQRPGDNLYTASTVALDGDTGKI